MAQKMLITRCPDCQTSFRITLDVLQEADGRVRCGRCGTVFSAFNSLSDTRSDLQALGAEAVTLESVPQRREATNGYGASLATAARAHADADADDAQRPETDAETPDEELISAREIESVLAGAVNAEPSPPWSAALRTSRARPARIWVGASLAAVLVLLGQLVHHFRGTLVGQPLIGPPLAAVYARLGVSTQPSADPADFEIVDWLATAGANDGRAPTLRISAGIVNRSSRAEVPPLLFLKLTDRFGNPIGTRYFEPSEYLDSSSSNALLAPGATATARLELVDPGPQAYGFEVDTCVRLDTMALRCKSDLVFE
jgi:predicted Zn finger-like uncharacterized protein